MSTVIGDLRVTLGLDTSAFQSGVKQTQSSLADIGKRMAPIGTGNAEVMAAAEQGMNRALQKYDRTLPTRVLAINRDPRRR